MTGRRVFVRNALAAIAALPILRLSPGGLPGLRVGPENDFLGWIWRVWLDGEECGPDNSRAVDHVIAFDTAEGWLTMPVRDPDGEIAFEDGECITRRIDGKIRALPVRRRGTWAERLH